MSQQTQIPLHAFTDLVCNAPLKPELPRCDSKTFTPVFAIKTYQGLMSNNQKVIAQQPLFKCVKCGAIHDLDKKPSAHGGLTLNEL